jgi:hypothetical protein
VRAGLNSECLSWDVLETLGFAKAGEDALIHSTAVIVEAEPGKASAVGLGVRYWDPAKSYSFLRNRKINAPVAGILCQCNAAVMPDRCSVRPMARDRGCPTEPIRNLKNCCIGSKRNRDA